VPNIAPVLDDRVTAVAQRVRSLETKPRLDLDDVSRAIGRLRRPGQVASRLGPALRYAQRVEAEVAGLSIETLLPNAHRDLHGRFLAVWVPDELGHAEALGRLLRGLDLPPVDPRAADSVPVHNRVAGLLGRLSLRAYEIVSMTYHSIGAINERLALGAYTRIAEILDELGERPLVHAMFGPMRRDESMHLGYYRTYARQQRHRLKPWQLTLVRALIVNTYAPVGAGMKRDKPLFGDALRVLDDDPHNPAVAAAVHDIANELIAREGQSLPPFALTAMRACL
jgi:hypothetical protein